MRWPWRPRPGMVRVSGKRLIELQRNALRACDLEDEIRENQHRLAVLQAQERLGGVVGRSERDGVAALAEDPPLTAEGDLHEAAFDALVEAAVWARREWELTGRATEASRGEGS